MTWTCPPYFTTLDLICNLIMFALGFWKSIDLGVLAVNYVHGKLK